jgi:hypothetical protein
MKVCTENMILPPSSSSIPTESASFSSTHLSLSSDHRPPIPTSSHVSAHTNLPPPGPDHFAARRALWLKPTAASRLGQAPSTSCVRLENLLEDPGALERSAVWDAGLNKVWRGLVGGGRLKNFLPLRVVVWILSYVSSRSHLSLRFGL